MLFISLRLTRINAVVLNIANMDHFLQSPASKNSLKKGYIEMLKSYFLEILKSVLGSSIPHYFLHKYNRFLFFNIIFTAPLLMASFFFKDSHNFPIQSLPLYTPFIFHVSHRRFRRYWKTWWNMFSYCFFQNFLFTSLNYFYHPFKICIKNEWCF